MAAAIIFGLLGLAIVLFVWGLLADIDWMVPVAFAAFVLSLLGMLGMVVYLDYKERNSPVLATLKKGYWACTDTVTRTVPVNQMVGKVMVTTYHRRTECVQYTRL